MSGEMFDDLEFEFEDLEFEDLELENELLDAFKKFLIPTTIESMIKKLKQSSNMEGECALKALNSVVNIFRTLSSRDSDILMKGIYHLLFLPGFPVPISRDLGEFCWDLSDLLEVLFDKGLLDNLVMNKIFAVTNSDTIVFSSLILNSSRALKWTKAQVVELISSDVSFGGCFAEGIYGLCENESFTQEFLDRDVIKKLVGNLDHFYDLLFYLVQKRGAVRRVNIKTFMVILELLEKESDPAKRIHIINENFSMNEAPPRSASVVSVYPGYSVTPQVLELI